MQTENRFISTCDLDSYVEKEYDRDISPISAIQAGSPIEFQIAGCSNFYVALNKSYIDIQCQVQLPDGGNLPADATVGPANLFPHAMFSNI